MTTRVSDPARTVLGRVLRLTLSRGKFPREDFVVRNRKGQEHDVKRLVEDRRYLARVIGGDSGGTWHPRLALTVLGIYEAETEQALEEAQGLARTRDRLVAAAQQGVFAQVAPLKDVHAVVATDMALLDFRRWCTTLCCPRLQARYLADPLGCCGWSDAMGYLSKNTGFFTHLVVYRGFLDWRLPQREKRRAFLLSEDGLRAEVDEHGYVHVHFGLSELALLPGKLGPQAIAFLVARRRRRLHSLDLQTAAGVGSIHDGVDYDADEVTHVLEEMGIEFDAAACDATELERLAAVVRRMQALARNWSKSRPPNWAKNPTERLREMTDAIRAELGTGPLKADYPLVKNATTVVRKALENVFEDTRLKPFRGDFEIGEWVEYRPSL